MRQLLTGPTHAAPMLAQMRHKASGRRSLNAASRHGAAPGKFPWTALYALAPLNHRHKKGYVPIMCCALGHYRFRLYAESLSLCLRERESNQRESAPGIRVSLRETSLVPALLRGSSRWAIPGPSFLIWHPCQTPLYTAPPLGLLTGPGTEAPEKFVGEVLAATAGQHSSKTL